MRVETESHPFDEGKPIPACCSTGYGSVPHPGPVDQGMSDGEISHRVPFGEAQPGGASDAPPCRAGSWLVSSKCTARGWRKARPSPICPLAGAGSAPQSHYRATLRPMRVENGLIVFLQPTGLRASHRGGPWRPGPAGHDRMLRVGIGTAKLLSRARPGARAPSVSTRTAEPVWVQVVCSPRQWNPRQDGRIGGMWLQPEFALDRSGECHPHGQGASGAGGA